MSVDGFVHVDAVRFADLDAMRHLNNARYLTFFEGARMAWLAQLLGDRDPVQPESDFGLIFAECHVNYRSPAFYGEELRTTISVSRLRRSSFRMGFEMRGPQERLVADGWGALVGFDYVQGGATALPDRLTAALRDAGATEEDPA